MQISRLVEIACSSIFVLLISAVFINGTASAAPKAKEIPFWNDSEEQSRLSPDHSKLDALLKKYVRLNHPSGLNRFDYAAVTDEDQEQLVEYISYLQQMDPRQFTKQRQKAYWLNLFNASIIMRVLDSEIKKSIRQLGRGLWRSERFYISMQNMSLDDIEHGVLRPIFKDPRVHFSLVAGTTGSANILPETFTADNIEALLDQNTKEFINHSRGVSFDDDKLVLSSIFKWYRSDFGNNFNGVKEFIKPYLDDAMAAKVADAKSADYEYSWALNKP